MPRPSPGLVYVGIKRTVIALNRRDGSEVWRTPLTVPATSSSTFVSVTRDGDLLIATCGGVISALDPKTGAVIWTNPLKGLGTGLASVAGEQTSTGGLTTVAAEIERQRAAAAAGAAVIAAG